MKTRLMCMCMCVALIYVCGCEDAGNTGTVLRYARGTRAAGDGKSNVWIWYIDDFGAPLEQAGLRFANESPDAILCTPYPNSPDFYWGGRAYLEGGQVTGEGGRLHIRGILDTETENDYPVGWYHRASNVWYGPRGPSSQISQVVAFGAYGGVPWYMRPDSANPTWNRPVKRQPTAKGSLSAEETVALSATTVGGGMAPMSIGGDDPNFIYLPETGIDYVFALIQQQGSMGYGYSLQVSGIIPIDSAGWEDNFRYQSPFMYSLIAATAEPIEAQGKILEAVVKSNALPEGIPVEMEVVAQNAEKTVSILHTDYFLPVTQETYALAIEDSREPAIFDRWSDITEEEAYLYDPNNFPDPNYPPMILNTEAFDFMERHDTDRVKPLHYIPVEENDELRIQIVMNSAVLSEIAHEWLGSNKCLDVDNNGIVNLSDVYFGF